MFEPDLFQPKWHDRLIQVLGYLAILLLAAGVLYKLVFGEQSVAVALLLVSNAMSSLALIMFVLIPVAFGRKALEVFKLSYIGLAVAGLTLYMISRSPLVQSTVANYLIYPAFYEMRKDLLILIIILFAEIMLAMMVSCTFLQPAVGEDYSTVKKLFVVEGVIGAVFLAISAANPTLNSLIQSLLGAGLMVHAIAMFSRVHSN